MLILFCFEVLSINLPNRKLHETPGRCLIRLSETGDVIEEKGKDALKLHAGTGLDAPVENVTLICMVVNNF